MTPPAPAPAAPEPLRVLIRGVEQAICARLDRIESSLQQLHCPLEAAGAEERIARLKSAIAPVDTQVSFGNTSIASFQGSAADVADAERGEDGLFSKEALTLRKEWAEQCAAESSEAIVVLRSKRMHSMNWDVDEEENADDESSDSVSGGKPWWILLPSTRRRLVWDILMVLIIAHDMAVVPVTLAFETGDNALTQALFWPFLMFWTLDIPLSFVTGFYRTGQIEVRPSRIALNYASTWFLLDIFMVGSTWFEVVISESSQGFLLGRVGKSLRGLRVIHSIRILRLVKLRRISEEFHDRITSEYYHVIVSMFKLILTIIWINHFIACSWWFLGASISSNGGDSWTVHYKHVSVGYKYFTSLHWSLTQFTPASMEVSAANMPERIFSVIVLLFAMIAFSSFVSSITASMTQLRSLHNPYDSNFALLRRYLRHYEVPMDLSVRILHCVDYRLSKQRNEIQESQVQFLEYLSKPLHMELSLHIFSPVLTRHPFLQRFGELDSGAMRRLCCEAVSKVALSIGDTLFEEDSSSEEMFFLMSGQLRYSSGGGHAAVDCEPSSPRLSGHAAVDCEPSSPRLSLPGTCGASPGIGGTTSEWVLREDFLEEGEWCCELSMWCRWVHCGTMSAARMSEILAVDAAAFIRITSSFNLVNSFATRYADFLIEHINADLAGGSVVSDMSGLPVDAIEEVIERAYFRRRTFSSPGSRGGVSASLDGAPDKVERLPCDTKDSIPSSAPERERSGRRASACAGQPSDEHPSADLEQGGLSFRL